jgi:hypothetical protein
MSPPATTGGRNPRGSASGQTVPLYRGGVARIVPEFCARLALENGVTPCARGNKEFLARGVFCLFNCCTDTTVRRMGLGSQTRFFAFGVPLSPFGLLSSSADFADFRRFAGDHRLLPFLSRPDSIEAACQASEREMYLMPSHS